MRRGRILRAVTFVASFVLVVGVQLASLVPARADGPAILGAGSTWSQIAIDQWRADVYRYGVQVNYQGVGSTTGRQFFAAGTVDFAASEIPFMVPPDPPVSRSYVYLPDVAGGTSMMYNLTSPSGQQIRDLRLTPATIAAIFTGKITTWSDKRIEADYGKPLPNIPIKVLVRSDGSGTSAQFSAYINATEGSMWRSFISACHQSAQTFTSFWPYGQPGCLQNAIGQRGSDGIANYIANPGLGNGAIGYLEAAYAVSRNFPVVAVKNASGNFTLPTAANVAIALQHAKLHADSTQDLSAVYTAPEHWAYPISSYSYLIAPTDASITTAKGNVLGQFIIYLACTGQQAAARLGYSPMPKQLVQFAFDAEKQIPGAPAPPAIDSTHCPNPTITGSFATEGGNNLVGSVPWPQPSDGGGGGGGSTGSSGGSSIPGTTGGGTTGGGTTSGIPGSGSGSGSVGPGGTVTVTSSGPVLDEAALGKLKKVADSQVGGLRVGTAIPLIAAAFAILLIVFGPFLLRRRTGEP
ncbi:MAG TPA: phosphate ABC transporter substrate-binding protein PstS [Actinomycetota bacterium]|nr:phosphate ABC transporter substrate-binding protein PstS [Actinomycetota bacterium]